MMDSYACRAIAPLRWPASVIAALSLSAALLTAVGCESESDIAQEILRNQQKRTTEAAAVDHLAEAMRYLHQLAELDREEAARQISFHLNQWEGPEQRIEWSKPELIATWPPIANQFQEVQNLAADTFLTQDVAHFELCYLASRVTSWGLASEPIELLHDQWLEEKLASLPADEGRDLERAVRLFDWTVRNIRLEPMQLLSENDQAQAPAMPFELQFMGPGYRQTALQTLWRGSGDAWCRSRVFLELCRQLGIDSCMLATDGPQLSLWLVATRIGDQLYLFEPNLGIAVPGPNQTGIATLKEAQTDPSVLRRLRVPGWFEYPVTPEQIRSCVALIDASPEMLSRRMHALESALTGANRMKLTLDVDRLAQRLTELDGIDRAELWPMSLISRIYDATLSRMRRDDPALNRYYMLTFGILSGDMPVGLARWKHLTGQFSGEDDVSGAREIYMATRLPEADIEALPFDVELQTLHDLRRAPSEEPEAFAFRIGTVQQMMRSSKESAAYWLALLQMDDGRFETAENWLRKRVLDADSPGTWKDYARYNLGRCDEQLGDLESAIELYKTRNVPQEQGNRIRARFLSRRLEQPGDEESPAEQTAENDAAGEEEDESASAATADGD